MARADSQRAIGAVTRLLQEHLIRRGFTVTVGKPERAALIDSTAKLNLFLYETMFDGSLRNHQMSPGDRPSIWLALRYLITAFDDEEQSDSAAAHELLGRGLMALQELNFLGLDAALDNAVRLALEQNPEPLKLTFEESNPDLLSKLMQGSDETFRLSASLQVRPVLLLPSEPTQSSLLVGVDYSTTPATEIGVDGIGVAVSPTMGAALDRVEPLMFEPGEIVTLYGRDLHLAGLEAVLGDTALRVTGQWAERMTVEIEATAPGPAGAGRIVSGLGPSAGEHPLKLREARPGGRFRSSNLLTARLRPVVADGNLNGNDLVLNGQLLGGNADDVSVALFGDGVAVRVFETVVTRADQTRMRVVDAVAGTDPGAYLVIVTVNGVQARVSPQVVFA